MVYDRRASSAIAYVNNSYTRSKDSVKNFNILLLGQVLCRGLNAGRVTMCKSGKDRTAMSVTSLEQARLLQAQHGVTHHAEEVLTRAFRVSLRRDCVMKNVGVSSYAFNRLQRALLPKQLQSQRRLVELEKRK